MSKSNGTGKEGATLVATVPSVPSGGLGSSARNELEHELRFHLEPQAADSFPALPLLEAAGPSKTLELLNTYFDTSDFRLARAGCSLRVRQSATMLRQTLKVPAGSAGMPDLRLEMERDITASHPSFSEFEKQKLPARLRAKLDERRLKPVFLTQYRRSSWNVMHGASVIEVSQDRGEISANGETFPLCEVELELKRGFPRDLFALAMELCRLAPLAMLSESKSARGARWAQGSKARPRLAKTVKLTRKSAGAEAFSKLVQESLGLHAANATAFANGQRPEAVHQMRVALRRLWAVIWVFKPLLAKNNKAELAELLDRMRNHLAPARSAVVFQTELLGPASRDTLEKSLRQQVRELAANLVAIEHHTLAAHLQTPEHAIEMLQLRLLLTQADEHLALADSAEKKVGDIKALVVRRLAKLQNRLDKVGEDWPAPVSRQFHALRLLLKKQRYSAEMFGQFFKAAAVARYIRDLAKLQTGFGEVNDIVSSREEILRLCNALAASRGADIAAGLSRQLLGWRSEKLSKEKKALARLEHKIRVVKQFW